MDEEEMRKKISEISKTISKDMDYDPYIGPVGTEGLYQISKGVFTGKEGYEQFLKELNKI